MRWRRLWAAVRLWVRTLWVCASGATTPPAAKMCRAEVWSEELTVMPRSVYLTPAFSSPRSVAAVRPEATSSASTLRVYSCPPCT